MNKRRLLLIIFVYALALALATACSTGPVKSCVDYPEQMRCQPRERGGRQVKWKMPHKIRIMICNDKMADPKLVQLAKCRRNYMLAGL